MCLEAPIRVFSSPQFQLVAISATTIVYIGEIRVFFVSEPMY